jgi:hypothetical protein
VRGGQGICPIVAKSNVPGESTSQIAFAFDFARSSGEITLTSILGPSFPLGSRARLPFVDFLLKGCAFVYHPQNSVIPLEI